MPPNPNRHNRPRVRILEGARVDEISGCGRVALHHSTGQHRDRCDGGDGHARDGPSTRVPLVLGWLSHRGEFAAQLDPNLNEIVSVCDRSCFGCISSCLTALSPTTFSPTLSLPLPLSISLALFPDVLVDVPLAR